MIDSMKRIVKFGDNDVKMASTEYGIIFGDSNVEDEPDKELEELYEFGIILSVNEIIQLDKDAEKQMSNENKEIEFADTTLIFKDNDSIEVFRKFLRNYADIRIKEIETLREYIAASTLERAGN